MDLTSRKYCGRNVPLCRLCIAPLMCLCACMPSARPRSFDEERRRTDSTAYLDGRSCDVPVYRCCVWSYAAIVLEVSLPSRTRLEAVSYSEYRLPGKQESLHGSEEPVIVVTRPAVKKRRNTSCCVVRMHGGHWLVPGAEASPNVKRQPLTYGGQTSRNFSRTRTMVCG